jgi:hypothetical protein
MSQQLAVNFREWPTWSHYGTLLSMWLILLVF